jgi:sulfate permease, SulP family
VGGLIRWPGAPILRWLPAYDRSRLRGDLLAAAVVTALVIPQALGYAAIAGVPVQVGLYAIPGALLAYAVLGSSPHLVVGPVSTVSVVSGSIVAAQAGGDPDRAVAFTIVLALLSGLVLLLAGILRLGWVAEFLSKPIVTGFVFGLSLVIIITEAPRLLGLPVPEGGNPRQAFEVVTGLTELHPPTAAIGLGALLLLFLGGRLLPRVPWGLVLVVAALLVSAGVDLQEADVEVIGEVPRGLQLPGVPDIAAEDLPGLLFGAGALALVGLAETLSAARMYANVGGYRIDADQEFVATGMSNLFSGLSGGFGVAGSLSKTAAAVRTGASSQITGLATAVIAVGVLLVFAPTLGDLPRTILAAIVIHAVWGLMDLRALRRFLRVRRNDFVAAVGALLGVLVFGTLNGLLIAIGLSVLGLIYRAGRVEVEEMGRIEGEKAAWGSVSGHPERRTIEGILILRLNAPLFWVNAAPVVDRIVEHVDAAPDTRIVILDLEATDQLDTTSADALMELIDRLEERGIDLSLVRVLRQVRRVLHRTGIVDRLGYDHMWRTISQGVKRARKRLGVEGWEPDPTEGADEHIAVRSEADEDPGSDEDRPRGGDSLTSRRR